MEEIFEIEDLKELEEFFIPQHCKSVLSYS